jgi:hypothetical protein
MYAMYILPSARTIFFQYRWTRLSVHSTFGTEIMVIASSFAVPSGNQILIVATL